MIIKRSNYETFFIDYYDGKLDEIRKAELFTFLEKNSDLQEEFELFGNVSLEANIDVYFTGKDKLKKDVLTIYNYKTRFIAYFENDLDAKGKDEVETFLKNNPVYIPEFELFRQTQLTPETEIVYPKKKGLKRGGKVISLWSTMKPAAVAAAIVALFLLTYFLYRQDNADHSVAIEKRKAIENNVVQNSDNAESVKESNEKYKDKNNQNKDSIITNPVIKQYKIVDPNTIPTEEAIIFVQNRVSESDTTFLAPEPIQIPDNPPISEEEDEKENNKFFSSGIRIESVVIPVITYGIKANVIQKRVVLNPIQIQAITASDIFDEGDLQELSIHSEVEEKVQTNAEVLMKLTATELNKIAQSANIKFDKTKSQTNKATTYTLALGNKFSVSHTISK